MALVLEPLPYPHPTLQVHEDSSHTASLTIMIAETSKSGVGSVGRVIPLEKGPYNNGIA